MTVERDALLRVMHSHEQLKVVVLLMLEALPVHGPARETLRSRARSLLQALDQSPAMVEPDATRDLNSLRFRNAVEQALGPSGTGASGG